MLLDRTHFTRNGHRVIPGDEGLGTSYTLRESRTGKEVRLRLPASYESAEDFHLVHWLDDDRFTLVSGFYGHGEPTDGDT